MSNRNSWLSIRLSEEERQRLSAIAGRRGYKAIAPFARASLGRAVIQAETIEALQAAEKRQAATLAAMRTEIARLQRTEYVLFAMLENLAKTIFTYTPPPPAEGKAAAVALGRAAYDRYLKAVGMSLRNGSESAAHRLTGLDAPK